MHLHDLTIKKVHEDLLDKKYTALELTEAFFQYIEKKNLEIGDFLSWNKEAAYLQAEKTDLALAKDQNIGLLAGVPLAIKDNILVAGEKVTAGSKILENYKAAYDATVVRKLRAAGAVFLGKTNLDEFGMGSSTENSAFKITKNPHDLTTVPGGSSGGSASAVASHMAVAALGSDTGGSIRQPAAFSRVVGLKPTYGAVSRYGLIALASSLDQIGPLAKNAADAAIVFRAIAGRDPLDATSVSAEYGPELLEPPLENIRRLTLGIAGELPLDRLEGELKKLKTLKFKAVRKISLPHIKYSLSAYYVIMPAEASSNLARYDGVRYGGVERSAGFGPEAKRRIILGSFVLSAGYYDAYYSQAQRVRALIKNDFLAAFKKVDVILSPTTPTPPFKIGEKASDPLQMYLSDIYTIPANLAGLPALTMPSGLQFIGRPGREADILGIGQYYERL